MVLRHILRYLIAHPDAKDTKQGILRWWIPPSPVARREEEVQAALDFLVVRGWVIQRQTITSQQIYGVDKGKLEEIRRFLDKHAGEAEDNGDR
jgi:hypothetical protein